MRLRLLLCVAVLTAGAAVALVVTAGGEDAAPTAQLWVDGTGGDCSRESGAAGYRDRDACSSLAAAWDAAQPGDTIRVKAGRYGAQQITGDKPAATRVIGEDGTVFTSEGVVTCGVQGGVLCANADHLVLENVTLDAGETHGQSSGAEVNGNDVMFGDVALEGRYVSLFVTGRRFTWRGGGLGTQSRTAGARSPACDGGNGDGEPIWIDATAAGATIDGIRIAPQRADPAPRSCSANGFHLEGIRIQEARDVTIRNVHFLPGSQAGSGHIFVTSAASSARAASGLALEGNVFTPVEGTYALQVHPNVTGCAWRFTANTFMQPPLLDCDAGDAVWTANLGPDPGCTGRQVANVFQRAAPAACGTNRYVAGDLGLRPDGTLTPGSPAVDAVPRDNCPARRDLEGDRRPAGAACDAGADELGG
jgi:hypothetical protein